MIILASGSPRRKELLERNNVPFCIIKSDVIENIEPSLSSKEVVKYLSKIKACDVFDKHPNDFVIGADTIVVLDDLILGKPKDRNDARRMLSLLRGRAHTVMTAVTFASSNEIKTILSESRVYFNDISEEEIDAYLDTDEPYDKAGAYAIQGIASKFISHIEGDYNTIVGFPIDLVIEELKNNKLIG